MQRLLGTARLPVRGRTPLTCSLTLRPRREGKRELGNNLWTSRANERNVPYRQL